MDSVCGLSRPSPSEQVGLCFSWDPAYEAPPARTLASGEGHLGSLMMDPSCPRTRQVCGRTESQPRTGSTLPVSQVCAFSDDR